MFIITSGMLFLGCRDYGSEPPAVRRNPREYTWTVDTLAYPGSFQTNMTDIWGSSPTNVYAVGHNDQNRGLMWHYDGQRWSDVHLSTVQGGTIVGSIDLVAVYGFSANDVWAVGEHIYDNPNSPPTFSDSSLIIHFDGAQWREWKAPEGGMLQSVWGSSPTDVWAGGWNTFFHFDGVAWRPTPVPTLIQGYQFLSIAGLSASEAYTVGFRDDVVQPIDTVAFLLHHFNGTAWFLEDSVIRTAGSPADRFGGILFAADGTLFSADQSVFKRVGTQWQNILTSSSPFTRIRGSSASNLFAIGMDMQIWHYNGVDWYRYPQFHGFEFLLTSVWTDGAQVFAVGNNGNKTIVLHGK
jgi:hypothetical protein